MAPDPRISLDSMASGVRRHYADLGRGQIHYAEANPEVGGRPLVLLHQTASSWLGYEDLIASLGDDYRIVAPDTPGFGGSDPLAGEVTVPAMAEAIVGLLQRIGIDECWLYGHHTGAAIAASMAAEHPRLVAKLMLSGPPFLNQAQRDRLTGLVTPVVPAADGSHLEPLWERHRRLAVDCPPEVAHRELILFLTAAAPWVAYDAVLDFDFEAAVERIECPVYVIGGELDSLRDGLEPTHDALSNSSLEVVPGAGIYLADQVPDLVAARIREWFA